MPTARSSRLSALSSYRTTPAPAAPGSAGTGTTRRALLGLAGALGAAGLSACATSGAPGADAGGSDGGSAGAAETSPENPFGVAGGELKAFVFDGGGGVPYLDLTEQLLEEKHPELEADIVRTEDLSTLQPQFVNGTPPDLFQNSGAGALDITSLTANGQLASLEDLMAAPSWDDPEVTVEESLNPGVREAGTVDDTLVGLNTVQYAWALWHDAALLEEKGWEAPATWDELMSLCAEIKADGIFPFAFTGQHANYPDEGILQPLVAKIGGQEVWRSIDNLEDGAWQQDAVREAAEALPSPGPTLADLTPNNPGAGWFVPEGAANKPAALELLRALLSKESSQNYAELSNSVTMVAGAHDDQQLSDPFTTLTEMIERSNAVEPWQVVKYPTWYPAMAEETRAALIALLLDDLDVDGFLSRCQKAADQVAGDDAIAKQTR